MSKFNTPYSNLHFDDPWNEGTSCWEVSPRGASLKLYCWDLTWSCGVIARTWNMRSDPPICIDIKLLADRARRIVASAQSYPFDVLSSDTDLRRVDLVGARSEINRFEPDLWHEDAQSPTGYSIWVTMIIEYSRAREIAALAPLLELAPECMFG